MLQLFDKFFSNALSNHTLTECFHFNESEWILEVGMQKSFALLFCKPDFIISCQYNIVLLPNRTSLFQKICMTFRARVCVSEEKPEEALKISYQNSPL